MKRNADLLAGVLLVVGGLNWGLVAVAEFDLVAWIFGLDFGRRTPRPASCTASSAWRRSTAPPGCRRSCAATTRSRSSRRATARSTGPRPDASRGAAANHAPVPGGGQPRRRRARGVASHRGVAVGRLQAGRRRRVGRPRLGPSDRRDPPQPARNRGRPPPHAQGRRLRPPAPRAAPRRRRHAHPLALLAAELGARPRCGPSRRAAGPCGRGRSRRRRAARRRRAGSASRGRCRGSTGRRSCRSRRRRGRRGSPTPRSGRARSRCPRGSGAGLRGGAP